MNEIIKKISEIGIVPVIKIDDVSKSVDLAKALCEGGLPCAEITFRTEAAAEAIKIFKTNFPEMIVGAGTVLTTEQVDIAVKSGAEFIVSPGLNPDIVKYCVDNNVTIIPGCSNASDIEQAIKYGLDVVKFFPAEISGGIKMIKALSAPYGNIRFMPSGGINENNINDYLKNEAIFACGGTWMIPQKAIDDNDFDTIKKLTETAVYKMLDFKLAHIGINFDNQFSAKDAANVFDKLFGFEANENTGSIFSHTYMELLKTPYLGTKGHIAISTNSVSRAKVYLEKKGVEFLEETKSFDEKGNLRLVYMKEEIGGFAIHLVQNK